MVKFIAGCIKKRVFLLPLLLLFGLTACSDGGQTEEETAQESSEGVGEYVYVPEFFVLEEPEEASIGNVIFQEDRMYYVKYEYDMEAGESSETLCYRLLNQPETEEVLPLTYEAPEGYTADAGNFYPDGDGGFYVTWSIYPIYVEGKEVDYSDNTTMLVRYDEAMNQLWAMDLKEVMTDQENAYIQMAAVGGEGKFYAATYSEIYVFDSQGAHVKTISAETDWIPGLAALSDGRVFLMQYGDTGMELREIDTAIDAFAETFGNLPDSNGILQDNGNGRFLVSGTSKLYEYDLDTQTYETLLNWADCNVYGSNTQRVAKLSDGRIAAYMDTYENDPEVVFLTKTEASKVEQKEILTLATMYESDQQTQIKVVDFNKQSSEYQIKIRAYINETAEWTETTYSDALTRLHADIVSGDSPDIIDLTGMDIANLAAKGALEDLTPYLTASTVANAKDFVPSVLDAYRIEDIQTTVPVAFQVATLLSRTSLVGGEPGWALEDIIALADSHPDAMLMYPMDKAGALRLCIQYTGNNFIDYEAARCSFDSPEFLRVLEFANRFERESEYTDSLPTMIQSGRVLLSAATFGDVQEYQMYNLMFEDETTCIGYPTFDGSPGVFLNGMEIYGISASSEHKEGAWKFVESVLSAETERHSWGFPSRSEELDKLLESAMTPDYQLDENGEPMTDENGEPIENPKTSWGYDDWDVDIYAASEKEIEEIRTMIEIARPVSMGNDEIFSMILEEAEAYFAGQKSAQEVAAIIQSRVGIYVSENS